MVPTYLLLDILSSMLLLPVHPDYEPPQRESRRMSEFLDPGNESFRKFVLECVNLRGTKREFTPNVVGSLLEEEVFDVGRWMRSPEREELRDAVVVMNYPLDRNLTK